MACAVPGEARRGLDMLLLKIKTNPAVLNTVVHREGKNSSLLSGRNISYFFFFSMEILILPNFYFFPLLEQILYNIKQEYKRMQKRRHLEASFQQTDPGCSSDSQPHAFLISGPASPGNKP